MRTILVLLLLLIPTVAWAVTTTPFAVDGNTYALYLLDGTAGSAAKLDNAEGTAARDLTQNGSPTASTGQTTPTSNGAYTFTRTANQNLQNLDQSDFPTGAMSIEMWIKPAAVTPGDSQGVVTKYNGGGDNTFYLGRNDATNFSCGFTNTSGTNFDSGNGTLTTATWHYVVCVYNPSTAVQIYVDGSLGSQNTTSIPSSIKDSTAKFMIGNYDQVEGTALNNFEGDVDAVKVSSVALTSTEISNYYNDVVAGGAFYTTSPWWFIFW